MSTFRSRILLAAAIATVACATFGRVWFHWSPFEADTTSYLFQARLLSHGRLSLPTPPALELAPSGDFNMLHGRLYSQYIWGHPAALALGVLAGVPWLVPAVETGLTLLIACLFVRRAYGERTALVAAVLMLVSPAVVGLGATWMSENTSRLALAVYLLGLVHISARWRRGERASAGHALMVGAGLGLALCTRPLTAVAFGVPGAVFLLVAMTSGRMSWPSAVRAMIVAAVPFCLFAASLLAYNTALTGRPLLMTEAAEQPLVGLGFGPHVGASFAEYAHPALYTPRAAIARTLRHTLPAISFNVLGWGNYRPDLFNPEGGTVDTPVAGLEIFSDTTKEWVVLGVRGVSNGRARITLESHRGGRLTSWPTVVLDGRSGSADLRLRIVASPEGYRALAQTAPNAAWQTIGTVPFRLAAPLAVGPVAVRMSSRDPVSVTYRDFVVDGADPGSLVSDPLLGGLSRGWQWSHEPIEWQPLPTGVQIVSDRANDQHSNEVQTAERLGQRLTRLYQQTSGSAFDVRVDAHAVWRSDLAYQWLRALPLLIVPLLIIGALAARRSDVDWLLAAIALGNVAAYALFYFEGAVFGSTPVHLRYHNEATMLALLPLTASGLIAVAGRLGARPSRAWRVAAIAASLLLCVNTAASYALIGRTYQQWNGLYHLPRLIAQANLHRAVVFLLHRPEAPLGDYPFVPLDRADVVYVRLGPAPEWGLSGRSWEEMYRRYFEGRRAFAYEDEELRELDVTTAR
jgi:hypothetical protein